MSEATELAVGDVVIATWTEKARPGNRTRTVRAHVTAVNAKRGKVEINWVHTSSRGREVSWSQKTKWVPLNSVRKVEKEAGERTPNETMMGIVRVMAGKETGHG